MAKKVKVEELTYSGGEEDQMSGLGAFFLVVGIIGLIVCFIVSGYAIKTSPSSPWGDNGISPIWIVVGVFSLIQGIALLILLNAGAEVIRLLKKLNGLNFSGKISEPETKTRLKLKCSGCDNDFVFENNTKCSKCGEKFESTTKEEA